MEKRIRNRRSNQTSYDRLEQRRLLAGDIRVAVVDGVLNLFGDDQANEVQVSQNAAGAFEVTGVDTTVDGGTAAVTVADPFSKVSIFMAGGNDSVTLTGLAIDSNLSFYGEGGNDRLVATDTSARHLHADGGIGDDVFELSIEIRKSAYLYLGDGNDVVALNSLFAGRNFKVFGAEGNDTFTSDSLTVGRKLSLNMENGDDSVLLAGSTTVRKTAKIQTGNGNDFVAMTPSNDETIAFRDGISLRTGSGDDAISVNSNISISSGSVIDGSDGTDSLAQGVPTQIGASLLNFETFEVSDLQARLDAVFAQLTAANIDTTVFGGEEDPLELTATTTANSFTEGSTAVSVDDGLTISGSDDTTISGATVSLTDFQSAEDVLSFNDTTAITGSFDATNGTMTLTGDDTIANYQSALRSVLYSNDSDSPDTAQRTLTFAVTAGTETVSASRSLNVVTTNDAPVISLQSNRTAGETELPIVLDNAILISDDDDATLTEAIVQISDGLVADEDVLSFQQQAGITTSFDAATGTLTMVGASGTEASIADYQSLLRTVTYENSSSTPTAGTRTIEVTINDGDTKTTESQSFELEVNSTLNLTFEGLDALGDDFVYEGWLLVDGTPVSTGRFTDNTSAVQTASQSNIDAATKYILTIEPATGDDPAPADTHVLAGDITGSGATLSIGDSAALGTDFTDSTGSFILATPSDTNASHTQGIWWLIPNGGGAGLTLPTLPAGWVYEGWVVGDDGPVSTGTFTDPAAADSDAGGPTAGPLATPAFPGQDFVNPAIDLIGLTAVISVEPSPDNSPDPFAIKPLIDTNIEDVGEGNSQDMANVINENQPSGTLTIQ